MDRAELEHLIELGLSERELAARLGVSQTTARRWLDRHGLATARALQRRTRPTGLADGERVDLVCPTHGVTAFVLRSDGGRRCLRCRSEAVSRRRRKVKQILVEEAGGACVLCGYSRCAAALQFHHVNPAGKAFSIGMRGVTRSLAIARLEAKKCVLLCSNCHAEVEVGFSDLRDQAGLPITSGEPGPG